MILTIYARYSRRLHYLKLLLRAARALVGWSVDGLAERSRVTVAAITRGEAEEGPILVTSAEARALRRTLEGAGVEFIAENGGGGAGVVQAHRQAGRGASARSAHQRE